MLSSPAAFLSDSSGSLHILMEGSSPILLITINYSITVHCSVDLLRTFTFCVSACNYYFNGIIALQINHQTSWMPVIILWQGEWVLVHVLTWYIQEGASSSCPSATDCNALVVALILQSNLGYFPWCIVWLTRIKKKEHLIPLSSLVVENNAESIWSAANSSLDLVKI